MPTIHQITEGRVSALWGAALIRGADGKMHALKLGDVVHRGDVILTTQKGIVELLPVDTTAVAATPPTDDIDRVIADLDKGDPTAATAATLGGDGGGDLLPGLRVDRVTETIAAAGGLPTPASAPAPAPFVSANEITAPQGLGSGPAPAPVSPSPAPAPTPAPVPPAPPTPPAHANEAPVAHGGAVTGLEDSTLPLSLGGSDVDGSVAGVTITGVPANGALLLADGVTPVLAGQTLSAAQAAGLLFKPTADFNGHTGITFTVTDDQGAVSAPASVAITVTPVNDAPVAQQSTLTGLEDTPISGNVLTGASDVDGDALAVSQFVIDGHSHAAGSTAAVAGVGTLLIEADGSFVFTPAPDYNGPVPVATFTVSDGALSTTSTLNLTVAPVNDAPVAQDAAFAIAEDAPLLTGSVTATDVDAHDTLAFALNAAAPAGLVFNADGTYSFDPSNAAYQSLGVGQSTTLTVPYTVTDGQGATSNANLVITVTGTNDAPVALASGFTVAEDAAVVHGAVQATDVDANASLSYSIGMISPAGLVFNSDGTYSFDPSHAAYQSLAVGESKVLSLLYTATDDQGATSTARLVITVTGTNDAPVAHAEAIAVAEGAGVLHGSVHADDVDTGATLTYSIGMISPSGFSFHSDGSYSFDPSHAAYQSLAAGQTKVLKVPYTVTDEHGATSTANIVITITGTNDAPVAHHDTSTVLAGGTVAANAADGIVLSGSALSGRDTDVDGDTLSVVNAVAGHGAPSTGVSAGGTTFAGTYGDLVLKADGSYTYVADKAGALATGSTAQDVFTYQVSDGHGGTSIATLSIQVGGQADTSTAGTPTITALANPLGLNGEYYGYNQTVVDNGRHHSDDATLGNLDHVADFDTLVNLRNAAVGGSGAILGTTIAASAGAVDARFVANGIDYGTSPTIGDNIGKNTAVAAGADASALSDSTSNLFKFLHHTGGGDAASLSVEQGVLDTAWTGTRGTISGLGVTSDAGMRITGEAYLDAGLYDVRVHADDGFRLMMGGHTVAMFDDIQSPTTRVYSGVPVTGGLTPLELIYWEQGGQAMLKVEFKLSGAPDSDYHTLGSNNLPLYSEAHAPVLSDTQDIVAGTTAGSYDLRTGTTIDGGEGNDSLTGSAARDHLDGGHGNDTLNGAAGGDTLVGGQGNDTLTGGAGHDVFRWALHDGGGAGAPAHDIIKDFDNANYSGDVLDLRDLLVGETHAANSVVMPGVGSHNTLAVTASEGNLANYLHFDASGGDTVVSISSSGGFSGGYSSGATDQVITIAGVDLVGGFSNDHQVINDLLQRGKLVTDGS
jgi:VCBS repeat-containing protein